MEHRWHVRRSLGPRVILNGMQFGPLRGRICDVGAGGVRVKTSAALSSNLYVDLVFTVEDHRIVRLFRIPVLIVWTSDNTAGLVFLQVDPEPFRAMLRVSQLDARIETGDVTSTAKDRSGKHLASKSSHTEDHLYDHC